MYSLPEHLKSLPAIQRISDIKYKLTELGSLLEFLLKEIDQDRNPTLSLGELVFQYSSMFSEPKSVSTAIAIRNLKIHGPKLGGRTYTQIEIERAPEQLIQAIDDLLAHIPSPIAEAVRRDEFDLGSLLQTAIKRAIEKSANQPSSPFPQPPPPRLPKPVRSSSDVPATSSSSNGAAALVGLAAAAGFFWWLSSSSKAKGAGSKPAKSQTPKGCMIFIALMIMLIIIMIISSALSK
jgi:hypothetical protein